MHDEETGADPRSVSASIEDPYVLVIRDDNTAYVARIDKYNEIEELERPDLITKTKWVSDVSTKIAAVSSHPMPLLRRIL